jgi:RimJ/RimL family protein N-acetyltransferase
MPILIGKLCRLRPLARSDMSQFLAWRQDKQLRQAVLGYHFPVTAEMEAGWFDSMLNEQSQRIAFFSIDASDDRQTDGQSVGSAEPNDVIGFCRLVDIDWISRHAELGIMIGNAGQRGRGVGTEATALLCRYAFDDLNLTRLWLRVEAENKAARRLYSRLGFQEEGRLRRQAYVGGDYRDVILMGLLREERQALDAGLAGIS